MSPTEPKPVHAMSDAERRELLRRRVASDGGAGMRIGGDAAGRRAFRVGGRLAVLLALAATLVVMFFRFTDSWRVAVGVAGLMGAYMVAIGRVVEGRADRSD